MRHMLFSLLMGTMTMTASAQQHYDVNTVSDVRTRAARPNEVIVKFKTDGNVTVKRNAKGVLQTACVNSVDKVLHKYGVQTADQLMPLTGKLAANAPRRVKGYNGQDVTLKDLSKLYCMKTKEGINIDEMIQELQALPDVEFAEPNYLVYLTAPATAATQAPLNMGGREKS